MHYAYIVKCSDGTYYTGYTNDLEKRLLTHNAGKGAKYTRNRLPEEIEYFEEYEDKKKKKKREYAIKRLTRKQKEKLISGKVLPAVQIK